MVRLVGAGVGVILLLSSVSTSNALTVKVVPQTNPGPPNWPFAGCYAEGTKGRTLANLVATVGGTKALTVAACTTACQTAGYLLAGVEHGSICYCGNVISNGGILSKKGLADCKTTCKGNSSEYCGGTSRLDVYNYKNAVPLQPVLLVVDSTSSKVSSSSRTLSSPTRPVSTSKSSSSSKSTSTVKTSSSSIKSSSVSKTSSLSSALKTSSTQKSSSTSNSSTSQKSSASQISSSTQKPTTSSKTSSTLNSSSSQVSSTSGKLSSSVSSKVLSASSGNTSSKQTSSSVTLRSSTSSSISSPTSNTPNLLSSSTFSSPTLSSSSTTVFLSVSSISSISSVQSSFSSQVPSTSSRFSSSNSVSSIQSSAQTLSSQVSSPSSSLGQNSSSSSVPVSLSLTLGSSSSSTIMLSSIYTSVPSNLVSSIRSSMQSSSPSRVSSPSNTPSSSLGQSSSSPSVSISPSLTLSSSSSSTIQLSPPNLSSIYTSVPSSALSLAAISSSISLFSSSQPLISLTSSLKPSSSSLQFSSSQKSSSLPTSSSLSAALSSTIFLASASASRSTQVAIISLASSVTTSSAAAPIQTLTSNTTIQGHSFQGCFTEADTMRALSSKASYDYTGMTLEMCAAGCTGYTYFGVEYKGECYCGNLLNTGSVPAPLTDCNMICPGDSYQYCGAGNRFELYQVIPSSKSSSLSSAFPSSLPATISKAAQSSLVTSKITLSSALSRSSNIVSSPTLASTTSQTPIPTSLYQGCYLDGYTGRILQHQQPDNKALTQESCMAACSALGYTLSGVEWSIQCYCDNFIYNGGSLAPNQADCNMPCGGNAAEGCGAGNRISLFSTNGKPKVYQPPALQKTDLPSGWVYMGCLQDNIPSAQDPNQVINTFPYMVWNNASNTPNACIEQCQKFGYNAAGLEYGSQCFCGDVENIQVASSPGVSTDPTAVQNYYRSATPQIVPDSQCNSVCTGNSSYLCGSGNLMSYYAWNGSAPLYSFNFPTGTSAGEYTFLIGGVVVPLMVSQVVTGKVTFTEKYGSGEPNGTGAYELDLTQIDNFSAAWRTMTGMQTDVFCSAGLTLPDKAGRQITIGGWAGQSNFGVRLYWPDGSDGVPGVNQWEEDPGVLSLQVPRWYASAMIMANGSMLIVGGEIGSNAAAQPTLEILPATGVPDSKTVSGYSNTTKYLDFLDRTSPFNLYPFICVVPSGIFIAYYNEARILDEKTFETIKTLPNMPGAVNDPDGGRTYQLEGTMVSLPQYYPYTANLEVLICGGSTANGGFAIDNCITTAPEDPQPEWIIERMPSRRVMPCIAGLPDGKYLILNGAQHGVAGFGLGGDPNLNAILYDPSQPHNSRMSIMANTTVARLYHSEATVLLDGRVLVTGSDPSGNFVTPQGTWPEEYRVEVFTPPYLLSGLPKPTFSLSSKDWDYGQSVTFTLTSGSTANLKVSMLGSVVSTHGNSMGQRTLFPAVTCAGQTCTIIAPPNAHVAPPGWFMLFVLDGPTPSIGEFVRIGKDPAGMGNWPANNPSFSVPGV